MGCLFCEIVAGRNPADIVYQDDEVIAFRDIQPRAPVHVLIVPKKHISGVTEIEEADRELIGRIFLAAKEIARRESVYECGFRVVVNSGPDAGQAVDHLHFHLLGGRKLAWPPG